MKRDSQLFFLRPRLESGYLQHVPIHSLKIDPIQSPLSPLPIYSAALLYRFNVVSESQSAMNFLSLSGDLCAAKFSDGEWYRAKVEKVSPTQVVLFFRHSCVFWDEEPDFGDFGLGRSTCYTSTTATAKCRRPPSAPRCRPSTPVRRRSPTSTRWPASPCRPTSVLDLEVFHARLLPSLSLWNALL